MPEEQINVSELKEELEELISLLAQTSDSSTINLASRFEKFENSLEAKDQQRWSVFKWFVGVIICVLSVLIPLGYIGVNRLQTSVIENT